MRKSKISDSAVVAILVSSLAYKIYFVRIFNGKMITGMRSGWKKNTGCVYELTEPYVYDNITSDSMMCRIRNFAAILWIRNYVVKFYHDSNVVYIVLIALKYILMFWKEPHKKRKCKAIIGSQRESWCKVIGINVLLGCYF